MKRLTFFTLLLVVLNAAAQTETDIRKHYTDVNKKLLNPLNRVLKDHYTTTSG
ncbi:MAG: hypothetical protein IPN56_12410 [Chitinophagaceae bacterium]|nr:hypothetical protein [Chitinophagaceae bacterium]